MIKKISFIGCGNMAEALMSGIIQSGFDANQIVVTRRNEQKLVELQNTYGVRIATMNQEGCQNVDLIFLCVKPNQMKSVCKEIKSFIPSHTVVVSIAAGVPLDSLENWLGKDKKIIRAMPNTPVMVQSGMTSLSLNDEISKAENTNEVLLIKELIETCGKCEIVPENLIDAVIGVSGSAPAYMYMMVEALADGAVREGMTRDMAITFAAQTMLGSAKMVLESGLHTAELKDKVASPAGTTIEAIASLEKNGFRGTIIEAVNKAAEKSRKMK